jgi:glycosyltransferase involved in cell wall biosynthesis
MRVLAIVPSLFDTSPGQRYRIEQWEPILKGFGIELKYAPFETPELRELLYRPGNIGGKLAAVARGLGNRARDLRSVLDFDAVYVFREAALLGPAWFESKISRSGVPMVFDFDDAIFVAYKSPSNGYLSFLKYPGKTATICARSTHVIAGNQYLADYALRVNKNVTIIPTTIDTDKYVLANIERSGSDVLTIGWSGSHSTAQHLDTVRDVITELAANERFRLRVIGAPDYRIEGVDVDSIPWRSVSEVEDLRPIDIGIMPLPDDRWSKGKCGLKALQYMALGIPTIVSPVGVNSTIINDGENGFIAGTPSEWITKIKALMRSPELRRRIGDAGRRTVEEHYSARVQAPRVAEIFKSLARKQKGA